MFHSIAWQNGRSEFVSFICRFEVFPMTTRKPYARQESLNRFKVNRQPNTTNLILTILSMWFFSRALRCLQFTEHWSFSIKNQKQNYYLSTSDKRKKTEHLNNLACVQRMVNCTCGWPNDQEYAFWNENETEKSAEKTLDDCHFCVCFVGLKHIHIFSK